MHPQIEVRPLIIHIQASLNQTLTLQDFTRTPSSPPSKAVAHLSDQQWYGECGLPNLQFEYDFVGLDDVSPSQSGTRSGQQRRLWVKDWWENKDMLTQFKGLL
ncbi:hypothetical protein V6N13_042977 [Hibiscus sabdariffa]